MPTHAEQRVLPYTPEQLTTLLHDVPGIQQIIRARSRGTPDAAYIDIDVEVAPEMTTDHTEAVTAAIRQRLARLPGEIAEVEVHFASESVLLLVPEASAPLFAGALSMAETLGVGREWIRGGLDAFRFWER